MEKINVYYPTRAKGGNPYTFTPYDSLVELNIDLPKEETLEKYYVLVASFEADTGKDDHAFLDILYHDFNIHSGYAKYRIPQEGIAKLKTFTSMSIGCIITINRRAYYVDNFGFMKLKDFYADIESS